MGGKEVNEEHALRGVGPAGTIAPNYVSDGDSQLAAPDRLHDPSNRRPLYHGHAQGADMRRRGERASIQPDASADCEAFRTP